MKKMTLMILLIFSSFVLQAPIIRQDNKKLVEKWQRTRKLEQLELFLDSIGYYESGNDPTNHNEFCYIGKYQFGRSALRLTGFDYVTYKAFVNNPDIWVEWQQDSAMLVLMKNNEFYLNSIILLYNDSIFNNILISKSGILAAAHLSGHDNVRKYFLTNGKRDPKDAYGTTLSYYLNKFSGYNF